MKKLRVWWIPQIGIEKTFYVPVKSPEEAKRIMDILGAYDIFQYKNNIKPDFSNACGVEQFNEYSQDWEDWYLETEDDYFDDVDEYCEQCDSAEELEEFAIYMYGQSN